MNPYWSKLVSELSPYVPGEQPQLTNLIKLNTNENPYGPSPKVLEAIQRENTDRLRLYPDPNASMLKQAIGAFFGVEKSHIFVGNGSDEVLAHVFLGLLKQSKPLLFPDITYSFYPSYAKLYEISYESVPLDEQFNVVVDQYLEREAGAVILANPNAPTGRLLGLGEIERLVAGQSRVPVVVDEAYIDFGGETATSLISKYPNLLVVQTVSKSRSLAGLRIGYALGNPELIEALERVKNSFNSYPLDRLAIVGGTAAFEDREYFEACCRKVIASRERLVSGLQRLGFQVLPSASNFVFTRHPAHDAARLAQALREQAILVRHFKAPRIEQFLRISIGTDEQCTALLTALDGILKNPSS
jgi:histidinol-phosphate aminotransferase